jgi:branched-subunit amino acid ABC-type transport system permease component
MKNNKEVFLILVSLVILFLAVPAIGAAVPGNNQQAGPVYTTPELNLTNATIANHTVLEKYAITPTPIRIEIRVSETLLPAPKGEMAAGPRSIGFSIDPVSLAIIIIVVAVLAAGIWYMVKRKPVEKNEDE